MGRRKKSETVNDAPFPPAQTLEGRENQMIMLATDLAEKQLREGTASSQVIYHYLKLGSTRERLEQERLRNENGLVKAKTDAYEFAKQQEIELQEVLQAFRSYSGYEDQDDYFVD